ncbi:sigma-70 family RNA polymerase sigma factor [Hyphomicrobium facile]|uniref:RNA polymerase sigma factor, sigma-70 family n=1 Tax=Hyphomicrobium facile TaxID=51670 RepID=A0A1I7N463_9HYPH|nr:sigma-70 family RNA polymerase sigma factor [Hyphomicrobium facile]SFV29457.1 RNA polymerase sigma factor, sigma-70 family [Hyphomicrobium facile]
MPPPLTKTNANGVRYRRQTTVDQLIDEVAMLDRAALLSRFSITNRHDPIYLPSEVLLHAIRATRQDNRDSHFEALFRILLARVESLSRNAISTSQYRNVDEIRAEIASRFATMIAQDRTQGGDRLDIFEVVFDKALAALRVDVLRKLGPERLRTEPIDDANTGEPTAAVERAAEAFLGQSREKFDDPAFRSDLVAAIDHLPNDEKTVIGLMLKGIPIDGKEPGAVTIAKLLGCTEKTVRNRRDRAIFKLRKALAGEYAS